MERSVDSIALLSARYYALRAVQTVTSVPRELQRSHECRRSQSQTRRFSIELINSERPTVSPFTLSFAHAHGERAHRNITMSSSRVSECLWRPYLLRGSITDVDRCLSSSNTEDDQRAIRRLRHPTFDALTAPLPLRTSHASPVARSAAEPTKRACKQDVSSLFANLIGPETVAETSQRSIVPQKQNLPIFCALSPASQQTDVSTTATSTNNDNTFQQPLPSSKSNLETGEVWLECVTTV